MSDSQRLTPADPLAHACPVCNAKPGEPCKNRTRSYRRRWPLEHPHRGRVKWARAITEDRRS